VRFDVVTVFPAMFRVLEEEGVVARALRRGIAELTVWSLRDFADDPHRTIDDRPYGGGPGMVMTVAPLRAALDAARSVSPASRVAYLTPQGRPLRQPDIAAIAQASGWILIAGRYEGIDERLVESQVDEEWSIGDYVLSGGELAAMVVMDAVIRLLPGVLGHTDSAREDSHVEGLLDHPHYTRPALIEGRPVPEVLLSGDHGAIERWRLKQALGRTWLRRPDLLQRRALTEEERTLLDEYIRAHQDAG
jgi:tRNA (guanine37-N1)-methyltransferase